MQDPDHKASQMSARNNLKPKGYPIPVRYERSIHDRLIALAGVSGLPAPALIRYCVQLALPQLESGEANILRTVSTDRGQMTAAQEPKAKMGDLKINRVLHSRLKAKAASEDRKLNEMAEEHLWPVVGGKPSAGEGK